MHMPGGTQVGMASRGIKKPEEPEENDASQASSHRDGNQQQPASTSINQQHLQGKALRADSGLVPLKVPLNGLHSRPTNHHQLACGHRRQRGVSGGWASPRGVSAGLLEAFLVPSCLCKLCFCQLPIPWIIVGG